MPETPPIDPDLVVWNTAPDERDGRTLLVLLHGYGSHENDLFGLLPFLPEGFSVAAVRAPLSPPWPAPGFSWYPIEGLDGRDPGAVTAAAERLVEWVESVAPGGRVGLLGFSQGAAVSIQALRVAPERFAFAVNLAGYAAAGELPGDATLAERRPPVFWGRGTHDDVIPPALVARTVEWLPAHAELRGAVYPGLGHSVSEQELSDVAAFLEKHRDAPAAPAAP